MNWPPLTIAIGSAAFLGFVWMRGVPVSGASLRDQAGRAPPRARKRSRPYGDHPSRKASDDFGRKLTDWDGFIPAQFEGRR